MTEEVSLTIKGVQSFGEDRDSQEMKADARYFKKGECRYLFYEEVQEGMEEPVKTRVKLHKNGVELVRSDEIEIRIEYALEAEEKPLAECFLRMKISQKA